MNKEEINKKIEILEKELAELKNAVEENEIKQEVPFFKRVRTNELYYHLMMSYDEEIKVDGEPENYSSHDTIAYKTNNYFHTKERAEEVCDKIKVLLKLERLHDIYCPDYVPDWNNTKETKYYIYYNNGDKFWSTVGCCLTQNSFGVYFPTEEITQKVCDILNEEEYKP